MCIVKFHFFQCQKKKKDENSVHLHQDGNDYETEGSPEASLKPHLYFLLFLTCLPVYPPSCRPILNVLADSDEESSSAGSSDEEELLLSEPQGPVGEKGSAPVTEG